MVFGLLVARSGFYSFWVFELRTNVGQEGSEENGITELQRNIMDFLGFSREPLCQLIMALLCMDVQSRRLCKGSGAEDTKQKAGALAEGRYPNYQANSAWMNLPLLWISALFGYASMALSTMAAEFLAIAMFWSAGVHGTCEPLAQIHQAERTHHGWSRRQGGHSSPQPAAPRSQDASPKP